MKKTINRFLSVCISLSILLSLCLLPGHAAYSNDSAIIVATNNKAGSYSANLPEGIVLNEGDIWVPADEPSEFHPDNSISPQGEGAVIVPEGYTYIGYRRSDSPWKVSKLSVTSGAATTIWLEMFSISGAGAVITGIIVAVLVGWADNLTVGSSYPGVYYDYYYKCDNPGPFPYIYFHHYRYYAAKDKEGTLEYIDEDYSYEYGGASSRAQEQEK